MVIKEKLIEMIDHCLYYSGESYAIVMYKEYKELIYNSTLKEDEIKECNKVISTLEDGSIEHIAILRNLKRTVEFNKKDVY
jgi:hypothetical protein